MDAPKPRILWAEDNAQDRMLIQDAIDALAPPADATLVPDGVHLLQALERERPALVVLDLKMPRLGGIDVLRRIRSHPEWKDIPVTVFSSGNRPDEIALCRTLGVQEVVQKPVDFDLFTSSVQRVVRSVVDGPTVR